MRFVASMVFASTLAWACSGNDDQLTELRLFSMGTWVDISIDAGGRAQRSDALAEIEAMLRGYERDYYAWGDGELARVNDSIGNDAEIEVSAELAAMLDDTKRLSTLSAGAFDPTVGGLVELWGFHSDLATATAPPEPASIEAWLATKPGIEDLTIRDRIVSSESNTLKLDLGGIAKGEAVDRIVSILRRHDIGDAIVNAGGDLRAIGAHGSRPWRVGIKSPREPGLLGIVEIGDGEAAFSSGDYERYFEYQGRRLHHILDPVTGYPVEHTQAITVIAADGVTADAAATALFVAGPERWRRVASAMGIRFVLRVDASGRIETTDEMRDRIQLNATQSSDIIVAN